MEEYCSCFGNEYARFMAASTAQMGPRKISAAQRHAMNKCKD